METIIKSVDKVDDKDKLIKVIQNLARILSVVAIQGNNKQLSNGLVSMSVFARDARKMFSMFKSIDSFYLLRSLVNSKGSRDISNFDYLTHLTKFFYYLFDNIQLLCGFNLLPFNKGYVNHLSLLFWTGNILCGLYKNLQTLYQLIEKRQGMPQNQSEKNFEKINAEILICFLDVTAKIGDLLSAFNALGLSEVLFKRRIDTIASLGGIYAGVIALWKTFTRESSQKSSNENNLNEDK